MPRPADSDIARTDHPGTVGLISDMQLLSAFALGVALLFPMTFFHVQDGGCRDCKSLYWTNIYALVPLLAGLLALRRLNALSWSAFADIFSAEDWKGPITINYTERTVPTLLGGGSVLWAIGNLTWLVIAWITGKSAPIPSWAEFPFMIGIFSWILALFIEAGRATDRDRLKLTTIALPVEMLVLVLTGVVMWWSRGWQPHDDDYWKLATDIAYPLLGALVTLCLFLIRFSSRYPTYSKPYRAAINLMLAGNVILRVAEVSIGMTTSLPSGSTIAYIFGYTIDFAYVNGGWVDFLFFVGTTLIGLGTLKFPLESRDLHSYDRIILAATSMKTPEDLSSPRYTHELAPVSPGQVHQPSSGLGLQQAVKQLPQDMPPDNFHILWERRHEMPRRTERDLATPTPDGVDLRSTTASPEQAIDASRAESQAELPDNFHILWERRHEMPRQSRHLTPLPDGWSWRTPEDDEY